jgi:hypothetical protein
VLGELAARVDVDVLPRQESLALLRIYRPGLGEADADRLAAALGDLPLALRADFRQLRTTTTRRRGSVRTCPEIW